MQMCLAFVSLVVILVCGACAHGPEEPLRVYTPLPDKVATKDGRTPVRVATADPRSATLTVRSHGARDCEVFLDGELLGPAPVANRSVPVGRRRVSLACASGGVFASTVVLHNGRSTELTIRIPTRTPVAAIQPRDMRAYVGEAVAL